MFLLSWLVVDNVRYYNKYSVLSANLMALQQDLGRLVKGNAVLG